MADTEDDTDDTDTAPDTSAPSTAPTDVSAAARRPSSSLPDAPSLDSMIVTPDKLATVQAQLSANQRAKTASDSSIAGQTSSRLDVDRQRMEDAYKASAAMPDELNHPWDAKAEMAKNTTDPVQAFGSIGSVFAMLAPAFAGLPMEASLNAGAAAINAVHQGDKDGYQQAYDAWQKNTELALKRQNLMHQTYNDATNLMNSNINAGRTKMELAATQFGDKQAQILLDNGMDKQLNDLMTSRNQAALSLQKNWDEVQQQHTKVTDLHDRIAQAQSTAPQDPAAQQAAKDEAIRGWQQAWAAGGASKSKYDFTADYISKQKAANPNWTPDDLAKWRTAAADAEEGTPDAAGPMSSGKLKSKAIQEIVDNDKANGITTSIADATRRYNLNTTVPSGNRQDDIAKQVNQYDNGLQAIDRVTAMIDKHVGSVGVAGYATRLGERLGNVAGSNDTDRSQIAHDIEYLQTIAPRLLTDSSGRPLSSEAGKINRLVAGLNFGDTTANTKRSLSEIRDLWSKMQQDNLARRSGTPNLPPTTAPGAPAAPRTGATPKWQSAPIVSPRADVGGDVANG